MLYRALLGFSWMISIIPLPGDWNKFPYAYFLLGSANGFYFHKNYEMALKSCKKAIKYSENLTSNPLICLNRQWAFSHLEKMYKEGLGVDKDEIRAQKYALLSMTSARQAHEFMKTEKCDE